MKTALLKKVRKRFKFKYLGFNLNKPFPKQIWEVIDLNGTEIEEMEHISHFRIGNIIMIDNPTIAEQLVMEIKGVMYVYEHRCYRAKMKNKSFKKKHFHA